MTYDLKTFLSEIKDFRRSQGQRYPLSAVLSMIVMAIISGCSGYREFARFMKANAKELVPAFSLKHGVPSHVTVREVLRQVDLDALSSTFAKWMKAHLPVEGERWLSVDGKGLGSTVCNPHDSLQNFVSVVSVFAQQSGLVHGMQAFDNGKSYEPEIVRQLIQKLGIQNVVLTLDALHCQKKR